MRLQENHHVRQHRTKFYLEGGREERASKMLYRKIRLGFLTIPGWQARRESLPSSSTPEPALNCPDAHFSSPLPPDLLTEVSPSHDPLYLPRELPVHQNEV